MRALIDGDILVYRFGFANQDRDGTNVTKERYVSADLDHFLADLLMVHTDATDYEGYLTASGIEGNFRAQIAVTAPYKGNRVAPKPVLYDYLRDWMVNEWGFKVSVGQEADDDLAIDATRYFPDCILCSIDKDLDQVPGKHFNYVKNVHYEIEPFQGLRNFYTQILTGDRTDNIIGIFGIGPKKAEKLLAPCTTEEELFKVVLKAYEGNLDRVVENGKLLWLRRTEGQIWSPPNA